MEENIEKLRNAIEEVCEAKTGLTQEQKYRRIIQALVRAINLLREKLGPEDADSLPDTTIAPHDFFERDFLTFKQDALGNITLVAPRVTMYGIDESGSSD